MPAPTDTSDLRALARVILDQEELEQAAMRPPQPPYDLQPVRRQFLKGLRVGSLLGIALGVASTGAGTASTFRQPGWAASLVLLASAGTVLGAAFGACSGLVTRWSQRRRLDRDLAAMVAEHQS
jgi:hypothetical protein